jgi:hypothetical protein
MFTKVISSDRFVPPVVQRIRNWIMLSGHGAGTRASVGTKGTACYVLGAILGLCAGGLDVYVGDLLLTALFVAVATMLLGALRPEKPWRWMIEVAAFVPLVHLLAFLFLTQKPDRAHIYESFLGFLTGMAGAYGGAMGRKGANELFGK